MNFAYGAAPNQLLCLCIQDGTNALAAHLENATSGLLRVDDRVSVFGLLHHRLLAIDVFTCFHGVASDASMPMVRRRHDHGIQAGTSQDFPIISADENVFAVPLLSERQTALVDIGDGHKLYSRDVDRR